MWSWLRSPSGPRDGTVGFPEDAAGEVREIRPYFGEDLVGREREVFDGALHPRRIFVGYPDDLGVGMLAGEAEQIAHKLVQTRLAA